MARREYDPEVKAAVMGALLQGQSISSVAREYRIPKGTVSDWRRKAEEHADGVAPDPTQKEHIGQLLIEYLNANLQALRAQATMFADAQWLRDQDANELGVLHGIMTDKAVRLLEAMSPETDADGTVG